MKNLILVFIGILLTALNLNAQEQDIWHNPIMERLSESNDMASHWQSHYELSNLESGSSVSISLPVENNQEEVSNSDFQSSFMDVIFTETLPNFFTNSNKVELNIYDKFGHILFKETLQKSKHHSQAKVNLDRLSSGTYDVEFITETLAYTTQLTKN